MEAKQKTKEIDYNVIDRCYKIAKGNYERAYIEYGKDNSRTSDAFILYTIMKFILTEYYNENYAKR
jgi:hypothetical protein